MTPPTPPLSWPLELAGETVLLLPERALWWPRGTALFVADLHAGRDTILRQHGMAMPAGTLALDLRRLDQLLARTGARTLVVLGDLVHRAPARTDTWVQSLLDWNAHHPNLRRVLVSGNHDRHLDAHTVGFTDVGDAWRCGPFIACHGSDPICPPRSDGCVLDGHVHPVVRLRHAGRSLRVPVFWQRNRHLTLPAFGSCNGGFPIRPGVDDGIYACAGQIIPIPGRALALAAPRRWR